MLHQMKLKRSPFEKIKNGSKTIELRLNDEKRQKVQVGDLIEFTFLDAPKKIMQTRVTVLHHFNSFEACVWIPDIFKVRFCMALFKYAAQIRHCSSKCWISSAEA